MYRNSPELRFRGFRVTFLENQNRTKSRESSCMNSSNDVSGKRLDPRPVPQRIIPNRGGLTNLDTTQQDPKLFAQETQKLSAVLQENRARIDKGWQEVSRLDQLLASLEAKIYVRQRKLQQAQPATRRSENEQPDVTKVAA
jgi:hypothetical protein